MSFIRVQNLVGALLVSLALSLIGSGQNRPGPASEWERTGANRAVRHGVAVEFSVAPAAGGARELMEGESAEVKFRLTDEATGSPLNSLYPGAWMDVGETVRARGRGAQSQSCQEKISLYLKNIVGIRPLVDLNGYFLLAMNKAANISVIDPRVGISGRTNLYARIQLKQPGADWVKTRDHKRLYVSMPEAGQVAFVDTETFKVVGNVDAGVKPLRVSLQADQKYLWVGNDAAKPEHSGVTAIDTETLIVAARIPTGRGHHEIAFSADDRYAFVSNREEGTVSVIDVRELKKIKDVVTGPVPISLAYSPLSRAVYVADGNQGVISVVDSRRHEVLARIEAKPGLGPLRFTSDGRWGLVLNTLEKAVHVVDAATNRLRYTIPVEAEPYQIALTQSFAYVRSLGSERVSLIQLALLGKDRMPAPNGFAAGASAPNKVAGLPVAGEMAPSPKEAAVYVLSPGDKGIYYYMEGMNAPSGSFQTYGESATAIEIVDRSLQEQEPGVYSTKVRLPVAGTYDVAFLLDSPRLVQCFSFAARQNPALNRRGPALSIEYLNAVPRVAAGEATRFSFRLTDPQTGQPRTGLRDVRVSYYMVPGLHRTDTPAIEISSGVYEITLALPEAGAYYVYVECPSLKVRHLDLPFRTLMAVREEAKK